MNPVASTKAVGSSTYPGTTNRGPMLRKRWFPVIGLLIVVFSTALQLGCINHALVIDDFDLVQNRDNGRGCGNDPVACFSGKLFSLYYRPMLTASFAVMQKYHIHDDSPRWFHIENLAMHAMDVALALYLFRVVLRRRVAALIAAALFAFHPVQVSVTTFIGGRTDILVLVFMLTFAIGVTRAGKLLRAGNRCIRDGSPKYRLGCATAWIILSTAAFLAAVFTKEQVIPIVLLCPLLIKPGQSFGKNQYSNTKHAHSGGRGAGSNLPFWLTIYLVPIMLYSIASGRVLKGDKLPHVDWSLGLHVEMVGRTLWYFTKTLFFPTVTTLHQSTLGPWDVPQYFVAALGYLFAAVWILILVRAWPNRRLRFMALWATLTLVTCVNLIPIPSTFASPYRAAVPLFGMAGLVGCALVDLPKYIRLRLPTAPITAVESRSLVYPISGRRDPTVPIPTAFTCALFAGSLTWCIFTSIADVPNWQDETALMKAEVAADPNYIPARAALANYFATQQPPNYARSITEYNACVDQLFGKNTPTSDYAAMLKTKRMLRNMKSGSGPRYTVDYVEPLLRCRGWDYQADGKYDEAIADYRAALSWTPDDSLTSANLAICYRMVGEQMMDSHNYQGAAAMFRQGLMANSDDRYVRDALIAAYRIMGQTGKADEVFRMEDRFTGKAP